jgi:hypothetical protein
MSQTHFSGPVASGDKQPGSSPGPNVGLCELVQAQTISRDATLVQTANFYLPPNSQIIDIIPDVLVAFDSATSATLTAGTVAGGPQYVSGVNAKTAGRAAPAYSAGQLTSMASTGTNTLLAVTVTSVGQPTVGTVRVSVRYVQTQ